MSPSPISPHPPPGLTYVPAMTAGQGHTVVIEDTVLIITSDIQPRNIDIPATDIPLKLLQKKEPIKGIAGDLLHRPTASTGYFKTDIIPAATIQDRDTTIIEADGPAITTRKLHQSIGAKAQSVNKKTLGVNTRSHGQIVQKYFHNKNTPKPA